MNHSSSRLWLIPFAVLGFVAFFTFAVHALWNGVLTDVLGVKSITYWQALGLLVLAKILFGGFPFGRGHGGWRDRMMTKRWLSMTPEQRQQMREEMRRRFGDWPQQPWCRSERGSGDGPDSAPKS